MKCFALLEIKFTFSSLGKICPRDFSRGHFKTACSHFKIAKQSFQSPKVNFIAVAKSLLRSLFYCDSDRYRHTNHGVVTCCYGFHLSSFGIIYRHLCRAIFCYLPNGETRGTIDYHFVTLGIICADVGKMSARRQIYPLSHRRCRQTYSQVSYRQSLTSYRLSAYSISR